MTHLEFDQCDIYIYDEAPLRIVLDEGARYADLTTPELAALIAALTPTATRLNQVTGECIASHPRSQADIRSAALLGLKMVRDNPNRLKLTSGQRDNIIGTKTTPHPKTES